MATYLMFMKLTEEGASGIADAKRGRDAGKKAAEDLGVTWKRSYLVMDEYDVIVVVEAPDDETIARYALLGQMSGAVTIKTVRAFTEREADQLTSSLADVAGTVS